MNHDLEITLEGNPGAIRMGADADVEWEPADVSLTVRPLGIGAYTAAEIDLAASCYEFYDQAMGHEATTSTELTMEDIDRLIAALEAIKADAIANRGFALEGGVWKTSDPA